MTQPLPCLRGALALAACTLLAATALAEPNAAITVPVVTPGNGPSGDLSFDRNGRFAVFASTAENLVPGQISGGRRNVFLYDRIAGSVRMVSHVPGAPATGGNVGADADSAPQISANGNFVVFTSAATDLVASQNDGNSALDVFIWNRETDTTQLVSRQAQTTATAGNGTSTTQGRLVTVSDEGRYVVFASIATNLISGQTANSFLQLYQFDRVQGTMKLISHSSSNLLFSAGQRSELSTVLTGRAVSGDGRFVAFQSVATNLVAGITDDNGNFDVYLWDRDALLVASLTLLSRNGNQPQRTGNAGSDQAAISADGKIVVFGTLATDLQGVSSDTNGTRDLFRYDVEANLLELVSHRAHGDTVTGNGISRSQSISAGGDQIAFLSAASNLAVLQDDENGEDDVFLWRGGQNFLVSHIPGSNFEAGNGLCFGPVIGPDGGVAFTSTSTDLVAGITDGNTAADAFYRARTGAALFLVSHRPNETATGNNGSQASQLLFGGDLVAFESQARDLVDGPINGGTNLFHHGTLLMADGFESGDLSAWSQHLP